PTPGWRPRCSATSPSRCTEPPDQDPPHHPRKAGPVPAFTYPGVGVTWQPSLGKPNALLVLRRCRWAAAWPAVGRRTGRAGTLCGDRPADPGLARRTGPVDRPCPGGGRTGPAGNGCAAAGGVRAWPLRGPVQPCGQRPGTDNPAHTDPPGLG